MEKGEVKKNKKKSKYRIMKYDDWIKYNRKIAEKIGDSEDNS